MQLEDFSGYDFREMPGIYGATQMLIINNSKLGDLRCGYSSRILSLSLQSSIFEYAQLQAFENLLFLDVSGVKLTSLYQLPKIDGLRTLIAAQNCLSSFVGMSSFASLSSLDVRYNQIDKLRGFHAGCLSNLDLAGNPISAVHNIASIIKLCASGIKTIDKLCVERIGACTDVVEGFCFLRNISREQLLPWAVTVREGASYFLSYQGLEYEKIQLFCSFTADVCLSLDVDSKGRYTVPAHAAGGHIIACCFVGESVVYYISLAIGRQGPFIINFRITGKQYCGSELFAEYETNDDGIRLVWTRFCNSQQIEVSYAQNYTLCATDVNSILYVTAKLSNGLEVSQKTTRIEAVDLSGYIDYLTSFNANTLVYMYDFNNCDGKYYIYRLQLYWAEWQNDAWTLYNTNGCVYTSKSGVVRLRVNAEIECKAGRFVYQINELFWEFKAIKDFDKKPCRFLSGYLVCGYQIRMDGSGAQAGEVVKWYASDNVIQVLNYVDYGLDELEYQMKCRSTIKFNGDDKIIVYVPKFNQLSSGPFESVHFYLICAAETLVTYQYQVFQFVAALTKNQFVICNHPILPRKPKFTSVELLLVGCNEICIKTECDGVDFSFTHKFVIFVNNYQLIEQCQPIIALTTLLHRYYSVIDKDYSISPTDKLFLLQRVYVHVSAVPIRFDGCEGDEITSYQVELLREAPYPLDDDDNLPSELVIMFSRIAAARNNITYLSEQPHYESDELLDTTTIIDVPKLLADASPNNLLNKLNHNYVKYLQNGEEIYIYNYELLKQPIYEIIMKGNSMITNITGELSVGGYIALHFDSLKLELESLFLICAVRKPLQKELLLAKYYQNVLKAFADKFYVSYAELTVLAATSSYYFYSIDANCIVFIFARASEADLPEVLLMYGRIQSDAGKFIQSIRVSKIVPVYMQQLTTFVSYGLVEFYGCSTAEPPMWDGYAWKLLSQQGSAIVRSKFIKIFITVSVGSSIHYFIVIFPASEGYVETYEDHVVEEEYAEPEEETQNYSYESAYPEEYSTYNTSSGSSEDYGDSSSLDDEES